MLYLPKQLSTLILLIFFGMQFSAYAQPSFTLPANGCVGDIVTLTANTGTFVPTDYSWGAYPVGAGLSATNTAVTQIFFPLAGTYSILLVVSNASSTLQAFHVITIHPNPVLNIASSATSICSGTDATLTASGAASYTWAPLAGLYFFSHNMAYVAPGASITYSVSGTSSVGCNGTASYNMVVDNPVSLNASSTSPSVCAGFAATLTASGATHYTWTSTSLTQPVNQSTVAVGSGTYSLAGKNGACADSLSLVINLAPPITLSGSASRNTICINDGDSIVPVSLTATGATHYSWAPYDPGRMTYSLGASTLVSPTVSTCYTLTGTTDICRSTSLICVDVETCTAMAEDTKENRLVFFPNPAHEKLCIQQDEPGRLTFRIITMSGAIMIEETKTTFAAGIRELDLTPLPPGIYLLYVAYEGKPATTARIIKQDR